MLVCTLQVPCPDSYRGIHRAEPNLPDPGIAYANEVKHTIQRAHAAGRKVSKTLTWKLCNNW